jgi:hypothetical protein
LKKNLDRVKEFSASLQDGIEDKQRTKAGKKHGVPAKDST